MTQKEHIDISKIRFESTVFPTEADMQLWDSLSPEEQRLLIARSLDAAEKSGVAQNVTLETIMKSAAAKLGHGL